MVDEAEWVRGVIKEDTGEVPSVTDSPTGFEDAGRGPEPKDTAQGIELELPEGKEACPHSDFSPLRLWQTADLQHH